jgi:hypothetical protein
MPQDQEESPQDVKHLSGGPVPASSHVMVRKIICSQQLMCNVFLSGGNENGITGFLHPKDKVPEVVNIRRMNEVDQQLHFLCLMKSLISKDIGRKEKIYRNRKVDSLPKVLKIGKYEG